MITVICASVCVFALLSAFLFHSSQALCLIVAGAAACIAGLDLFLGKRVKFVRGIAWIASAALLICGIQIPSAHTSYGYYDYLDRFQEYTGALLREDTDKAEELQEELSEKYGETDMTRYLAGVSALATGNISEAESIAYSFRNKTDMMYFLLRESTITEKYDNAEEMRRELIPLYQDALKYHPQWTDALKNLGGFMFDEGEYEKASYYLLSAYEYSDEIDPQVLLMLGASLIEQGSYDKGLAMLDAALEYDSSDSMKSAVIYYAKKAGYGGETQ